MIEYDLSSPLGRAMAQRRQKAKRGTLFCDKVMPRRLLNIRGWHFICPYCSFAWERGGHKEGFVKAAAARHVYTCYTIVLFQAGFVEGNYTDNGSIAEPFDAKSDYHARIARSVKSSLARRVKAGFQPKATI